MQLTTTLATLLLAGTSTATIILGNAVYDSDKHQDTAVWIAGSDPCNYVFLGHGDPCAAGVFTLDNDFSYRFANCNNGIILENADGSLNHDASFQKVDDIVNCRNNQGGYRMNQVWVF